MTQNAPLKKKTERILNFPVVGIGASAGGLEALKAFFANVPDKAGMAYVVVVHMQPDKPSILPELLQKNTTLPVRHAENGEPIKPDRVYVAPPGKDISIRRGTIKLREISNHASHRSIDSFFQSLAKECGQNAVGVILSGMGADGTEGLKIIKAFEGLVLVQDPETAQCDAMPRNALNTGAVDKFLSPERLPEVIAQCYAQNHGNGDTHFLLTDQDHSVWLHKLFSMLRNRVGHDFSAYKRNTLLRRIARRMSINQLAEPLQYLELAKENPSELEALFRELLIGVTSFFREPESFALLQKRYLPDVLGRLGDDKAFRVWVPGCSTGEEAYTLAIIIKESLEKLSKKIRVQIFGTDIDKFAIDKARDGLYPDAIAAAVGAERLRRFFVKENGCYRIRKDIRDCVVFSVQDVLIDPPFSRLHLLCCRNLLIYLNSEAQKKLLPLFHYTLNSEGLLMLGTSESIGGSINLFRPLDNKWKIFQRQENSPSYIQQVVFPCGLPLKEEASDSTTTFFTDHKATIGQLARNEVLERFSPAALLIDDHANILHISGRTGKFLEVTTGPPTQNVLDLARKGLRIELSSAIRAATNSKSQQIRKNIWVQTNGDKQRINLHVCPLTLPKELAGKLLVVFEEIGAEEQVLRDAEGRNAEGEGHDERVSELEKELQSTRESHQTTIEELESSNEELKSTNEELQSSNEELQSTNEELESSKEELQSLNEELQTVNSELQSKLDELAAAHNDMRNLLNSTEIATIFVDNEKRVKRFTQEATTIVNFIPTDIGRPLQHVVSNLIMGDILPVLEQVLGSLVPEEVEVQTKEGKWHKMRIMPYRTMDNHIDGAVITFVNIDEQKQAQDVLEKANFDLTQAWQLVSNVFLLMPQPLVVLDAATNALIIANTSFRSFIGMGSGESAEGRSLKDLTKGRFQTEDFSKWLQFLTRKNEQFASGEFEVVEMQGAGSVTVKGMILPSDSTKSKRVLLYFHSQDAK